MQKKLPSLHVIVLRLIDNLNTSMFNFLYNNIEGCGFGLIYTRGIIIWYWNRHLRKSALKLLTYK